MSVISQGPSVGQSAALHSTPGFSQVDTGQAGPLRSITVNSTAPKGRVNSLATRPMSSPSATVKLSLLKVGKSVIQARMAACRPEKINMRKRIVGAVIEAKQNLGNFKLESTVRFKSFSNQVKQITIKDVAHSKNNTDFYSSDALLSQLGKASNLRQGVQTGAISSADLPDTFPPKVSFRRVINSATQDIVSAAVNKPGQCFDGDTPDFTLTITQDSHPDLFKNLVKKSPLGKMTQSAINDFNTLKDTKAQITSIKLRHNQGENKGGAGCISKMSFNIESSKGSKTL